MSSFERQREQTMLQLLNKIQWQLSTNPCRLWTNQCRLLTNNCRLWTNLLETLSEDISRNVQFTPSQDSSLAVSWTAKIRWNMCSDSSGMCVNKPALLAMAFKSVMLLKMTDFLLKIVHKQFVVVLFVYKWLIQLLCMLYVARLTSKIVENVKTLDIYI